MSRRRPGRRTPLWLWLVMVLLAVAMGLMVVAASPWLDQWTADPECWGVQPPASCYR